MSFKNHHPHRDKNHLPIVRDLEAIGCLVMDISGAGGALDIVAHLRDTVIVEIKVDDKDVNIYISQIETMATWSGFVAYVKTSDEAIAVMKDPQARCLTRADKDWMLGFVHRWRAAGKGKLVSVRAFESEWAKRRI